MPRRDRFANVPAIVEAQVRYFLGPRCEVGDGIGVPGMPSVDPEPYRVLTISAGGGQRVYMSF